MVQAIAAGTRVVGTDVDGVREILQSGAYGSLPPYCNTRALAGAIVAELRNQRPVQELRPEYRVEQFRDRYLRALEPAAQR